MIHVDLQGVSIYHNFPAEIPVFPASLVSYKLSLLHSVLDQVLSILRALVQPSRRARIATAGTEERWTVDPRHGGVSALRLER